MNSMLTEQDIDKIINMLVKIKMENEYKHEHENFTVSQVSNISHSQISNSREHPVVNNYSKEYLQKQSNNNKRKGTKDVTIISTNDSEYKDLINGLNLNTSFQNNIGKINSKIELLNKDYDSKKQKQIRQLQDETLNITMEQNEPKKEVHSDYQKSKISKFLGKFNQ